METFINVTKNRTKKICILCTIYHFTHCCIHLLVIFRSNEQLIQLDHRQQQKWQQRRRRKRSEVKR